MMLISEKTGWNVQWVRNGIELTILAAAWMMGGPIGAGTIITAVLTGLILRFSLPQSSKLLTYAISGGQRPFIKNKAETVLFFYFRTAFV